MLIVWMLDVMFLVLIFVMVNKFVGFLNDGEFESLGEIMIGFVDKDLFG